MIFLGHRQCFCVYVYCLCSYACTRYVRVACVLSQNQYQVYRSSIAEAVQLQCRSRVSSSCNCASSHGVCVRLVHSRRSYRSLIQENRITHFVASPLFPGTKQPMPGTPPLDAPHFSRVCPSSRQPHREGELCTPRCVRGKMGNNCRRHRRSRRVALSVTSSVARRRPYAAN